MFIFSKIAKLIEIKQNTNFGITIEMMANEMNLPLSTLNNIKNGIAKPSVEKIEIIAKYFGVDMNYFFDIETKKPDVESVSVRMTDGNEYMLKRFEELVAENALNKKKVEELNNRVKELEGIKKYTMPDVPVGKVAETSVKLKKTD